MLGVAQQGSATSMVTRPTCILHKNCVLLHLQLLLLLLLVRAARDQ